MHPSYMRESKDLRRGTKSAINYVHLLRYFLANQQLKIEHKFKINQNVCVNYSLTNMAYFFRCLGNKPDNCQNLVICSLTSCEWKY